MSRLIDTTEMYLRTILELEEENIVPLRARISERLGHSGPTVSLTVGRMERDGLVVVTPEYNHGYPGVLKSVLDLLLKEYIHKAVAFVGVSAGPWGGTRVIEAMVEPVTSRQSTNPPYPARAKPAS